MGATAGSTDGRADLPQLVPDRAERGRRRAGRGAPLDTAATRRGGRAGERRDRRPGQPGDTTAGDTATGTMQVRLHAPGDVTGLDPTQVIRTYPTEGATNVVAGQLPADRVRPPGHALDAFTDRPADERADRQRPPAGFDPVARFGGGSRAARRALPRRPRRGGFRR